MAKIPPLIRKNIMNYLNEIDKICPIDKAILFGSYASNRYSVNSDIDIAIFSNEINDDNRLKFMKSFFMRVGKYKLDIQPLAFGLNELMDRDNDFIMNEIKTRGIEIYSRGQ